MSSKNHMVPLSCIDPKTYPTLYKYWSAVRKDPNQPNLSKWMIKNREQLDKEIGKWSKWFRNSNEYKVWMGTDKG